MSIITDEMDRLKGIALGKFENMTRGSIGQERSMLAFSLGYSQGMDDARKIQEKIKVMTEEVVGKL